ncbi:rab gdp/gtp exchange factor [Anaeramoeba flamelloides]|uniref:Rab gdp/gtp exchange factor n=1 Tax=Anaeramoeba flamelloides TaxID=1746091 RepID=A0AAV7Z212_9EUKA|nr:rab gdp/gtp exchange factor [Anaeramoeba flamelloides]
MSSPLLQKSLKNPIYERFLQRKDFQYLHDYLHNNPQSTRLLITKYDQKKEKKPEKKEQMGTIKKKLETHLITFNSEDDSQFVTYNLFLGKKKNSQLFLIGKANGKSENESIEKQSPEQIFKTSQKIFHKKNLEIESESNCSTILEKDPIFDKEQKNKIDVYLISRPLIISKQDFEEREATLDLDFNEKENEIKKEKENFNETENEIKKEKENGNGNENEEEESLRFPNNFISNTSSNNSEESSFSTTSTYSSSHSETESITKDNENSKMKKTKENKPSKKKYTKDEEEKEDKDQNKSLENKKSENIDNNNQETKSTITKTKTITDKNKNANTNTNISTSAKTNTNTNTNTKTNTTNNINTKTNTNTKTSTNTKTKTKTKTNTNTNTKTNTKTNITNNTNTKTKTFKKPISKSEEAGWNIIQNFQPYTKLPLISKYIQKSNGVCFKILEMETIPEITSQSVLEFVEYAAEKCQNENVFPEIKFKQDKFEKMKEFFLEYIMIRISSKVFVSIKEKCKSKDKMLKQKLAKLQFISYQDLGIDSQIYDQEIFERSKKILGKVNYYVTPNQKLACIKESCLILSELFKGQTSGADDFLPCLVYCLLLTNPKKLQSNITFIESYSDFEMISNTAEGYYFTNLSSSKHFLENLSYDDVNVDPLSFLLRKEGKSELNLIKNQLKEFNLDDSKKSYFSLTPKKKKKKRKKRLKNKNKKSGSKFIRSRGFSQESIWDENVEDKVKNGYGKKNNDGNSNSSSNNNENEKKGIKNDFDFNFEFTFNNFLKPKKTNKTNKQTKPKRPNSMHLTKNTISEMKKYQFMDNNNSSIKKKTYHSKTNDNNKNNKNKNKNKNKNNTNNNNNDNNKKKNNTNNNNNNNNHHHSNNNNPRKININNKKDKNNQEKKRSQSSNNIKRIGTQKDGYIILNPDSNVNNNNKKKKNKIYTQKMIFKNQYPFYNLSSEDITMNQIPLLLSTYKQIVDKYEKLKRENYRQKVDKK